MAHGRQSGPPPVAETRGQPQNDHIGPPDHADAGGGPPWLTPGAPFPEVGDDATTLSNKDDEYAGSRDEDDVILAGNGDDTVWGQTPGESPFPNDDNDVIYGENGNDVLNGIGGNDTIAGGNGDDTVQGGVDDDDLSGGNGDDVLYGRFQPNNNENAGDDALDGGRGEDTLLPGSGTNTLTGGKDADTFVFDEASGFLRDDGSDDTNTITDLEGGDRIVFEGYSEPEPATGGDGTIDNESEAEAWLTRLQDSGLLSFEDDNGDGEDDMVYAANGDKLVVDGVADFAEAVKLFGGVQVEWTDDADVA